MKIEPTPPPPRPKKRIRTCLKKKSLKTSEIKNVYSEENFDVFTDKPKIILANKATREVCCFRHRPTEAHLFWGSWMGFGRSHKAFRGENGSKTSTSMISIIGCAGNATLSLSGHQKLYSAFLLYLQCCLFPETFLDHSFVYELHLP